MPQQALHSTLRSAVSHLELLVLVLVLLLLLLLLLASSAC
jgi:hypothetical protein